MIQRKVSKDFLECWNASSLFIFFFIDITAVMLQDLPFFFSFSLSLFPLNLMMHELQSHIYFQVEKT